jgi:hypothetical protein
MPTRSPRSSNSDASHPPQDPQALVSEQARQQLVMASEVSSVMCRAAEALQQIHHHVTQRAGLRYQHMADQMRSAQTPTDIMAIQTGLMTQGMQELAQYMHDMTTATLKIQSLLMDSRRSQEATSMASQAATASMNAWQSMMRGSNGSGNHTSPH